MAGDAHAQPLTVQVGIRIPRHQLGPSTSDPFMLQYAGFEFGAPVDESTVNMLRDFHCAGRCHPDAAGMLARQMRCSRVQCKPSYAYGAAANPLILVFNTDFLGYQLVPCNFQALPCWE